jgi:hypothetical protein
MVPAVSPEFRTRQAAAISEPDLPADARPMIDPSRDESREAFSRLGSS